MNIIPGTPQEGENPEDKNRQKKKPVPLWHGPQMDGVLVVDKPGGITSATCIARIKHGFGQKKIGHAGTLDPMAQGVLLVLLGQATKLSGYLLEEGRKVYSGHILLGVETDTWDVEGAVLGEKSAEGVTSAAVKAAFAELVGTYEQIVPAYSAAKHQGRPLYELARKGEPVPVKKKEISVFSGRAELVGPALVTFRVECSSGTYIRSLAHSLGIRLECGATLQTLTREYSHPFGLDHAVSLDDLQANPDSFAGRVQSIGDTLAGWPTVCLSADETARIKNGMPIAFTPSTVSVPAGDFQVGQRALLANANGTPLALASLLTEAHGNRVWKVSRGLWNS